MKIAFDENVTPAMVKVFKTLADESQLRKLTKDLTIESASDYTPKPGDPDYLRRNDVPWIRRFVAAGGEGIISGNTRMKSVSHERLALVEANVIVVFFEPQWNRWTFFPKCSLLLHWWPVIADTFCRAPAGSFWHVPSTWPQKPDKLREVSNKDQKLERIERQKAAQPYVRERRRRASNISDKQGKLDLRWPDASGKIIHDAKEELKE